MVQQFNNRLTIETQILEEEFNLIKEDLSTKKESFDFDERKKILKNIN